MKEILAKIMRSMNARVVTTQVERMRKFFKLSLLISYHLNKTFQKLGGKPVVKVIDNFDGNIKLKIDISRSMGSSLYWIGFHEFRELIYLHRMLKPEMVAIDVGANLGEYTLFLAKRLNKGRVFSYEPVKENFNALQDNIKLNKFENIEIFSVGLGFKNECMAICEMDDPHEGLSTVYPGDRKIKKITEIELKKLDELDVFKTINRLDFIKIDIEGGELFALKGGIDTIVQFKPTIMIEINEVTYRAAGYTSREISDFFSAFNYMPYQVNGEGNLVKCEVLPSFGNIIYKTINE